MTRSAARDCTDLACILLAAGGSRRLGHAKQLVRYRTRPLLAHACATARCALPGSPLIVVVGAEALRLRLVLRRAQCGARVVANSCWRDGMATSLQAGLDAVPSTAKAVLVMLVDQPLVGALALTRLVNAWRRRPGVAAAARYGEQVGAPAVLPRKRWRGLKELRGDQGARTFLRSIHRLTLVDIPEAALDVDTPADMLVLARMSRRGTHFVE